MKKTLVSLALLFFFGGIFLAGHADASFYKYVDKNGVVCFADNMQVIPEQYRTAAVIVQDKAADEDAKPAEPKLVNAAETPSVAQASPVTEGPRPFTTRLLISGAVVIGAVLLFGVAGTLPRLRENKKFLSLLQGSLIGLVALYLSAAHAKDVMTLFGIAGQTVEKVQQQSAEKGKKAGEAMKSLDALIGEAQKAQKAQNAEAGEGEDCKK